MNSALNFLSGMVFSHTLLICVAVLSIQCVVLELVSGNEEIKGKVVDERGGPVSGVQVSLDVGKQILLAPRSSSASEDGVFKLTGLPSGSYKLTALIPIENRETRRNGPQRRAVVETTTGQKEITIVFPSK